MNNIKGHRKRTLAVFSVMLVLSMSLVCCITFSDDSDAYGTVTLYKGENCSGYLIKGNGGMLDEAYFITGDVSGSVPGLSICWASYAPDGPTYDYGSIYYSGTPTATGTYTISYTASSPLIGDYSDSVTVKVIDRSWTVTYNANGGTSSKSSDTVSQGSSVTLPSASRTNYTFSGWYTAASGGTRQGGAGDSYTPSSNITLYAQWSIIQYTVTYDSNGGSSASPSTVNAGSTVTLPAVTKTNNTFDGWYTALSGGTKMGDANDTITPTSNTTLYAHWTVNKYTVTFNANGGSPDSSSAVNVGSSVTAPSVSRTGYQLDGWYTAASGGTKKCSANGSFIPSADITLYAHWKQIITISTSAPVSAVVGSSYSYTPSANISGCTVTISNAPSWLSVSNGKIVGTPTSNGSFSYTVTMTKSGCVSATQTVSGTVYSSLTFTNPTNYSMAYVVVGQ